MIAGVCLKEKKREFESKMSELRALCEACGIEPCAEAAQNSRSMDPSTAFRSGKADELKELCEATGAELVVFLNPLSIQTAQRLSAVCGVEVIDRTALILDIFSQRARTKQAKLQTEMARLQYDLPRLLDTDNDSGHERGGSATNRGAGEMRSRLIERRYAARIRTLKEELEKIRKQRWQDERRRTRTMMRRAALVGYTNAGKSSLMNAFLSLRENTGTDVSAEDKLFATLDTSVRMIRYDARSFLLYDTVGFVSDLPTELVEAFRSTLDAARDADLLIHVIDASDPMYEEKTAVTEETLKLIGADHIPVVRVYNKCDLTDEALLPEGNHISCLKETGVREFLKNVCDLLYPEEECADFLIPYDKMAMVDSYKTSLVFEKLEDCEGGMMFRIRGPKRYLAAFREMKMIKEKEHEDSLGKDEQQTDERSDEVQ